MDFKSRASEFCTVIMDCCSGMLMRLPQDDEVSEEKQAIGKILEATVASFMDLDDFFKFIRVQNLVKAGIDAAKKSDYLQKNETERLQRISDAYYNFCNLPDEKFPPPPPCDSDSEEKELEAQIEEEEQHADDDMSDSEDDDEEESHPNDDDEEEESCTVPLSSRPVVECNGRRIIPSPNAPLRSTQEHLKQPSFAERQRRNSLVVFARNFVKACLDALDAAEDALVKQEPDNNENNDK